MFSFVIVAETFRKKLNGIRVDGSFDKSLFSLPGQEIQILSSLAQKGTSTSLIACDFGPPRGCLIEIDLKNPARVRSLFSDPKIDVLTCIARKSSYSTFAALLKENIEENREVHFNYRAMEFVIGRDDNFREIKRVPLNVLSKKCGHGSICELSIGHILVTNSVFQNVYLLNDSNSSRPLKIPQIVNEENEKHIHSSMAIINEPVAGGMRELLVLPFWKEKEIAFYSLGERDLIQYRSITIDMNPFETVWIPSRDTLLVSSSGKSKSLRLFTFEQNWNLRGFNLDEEIWVREWQLMRNANGEEKGLICFDLYSNSIKSYEFY